MLIAAAALGRQMAWNAGNFRTVEDLFIKRNLWALAAIRNEAQKCAAIPRCGSIWPYGCFTSTEKMQRYSPDSGFPNMLLVGTYYLPQIGKEIEVSSWYQGN